MKVVNIMQIIVTEYVTEILEDVPVKDSFLFLEEDNLMWLRER